MKFWTLLLLVVTLSLTSFAQLSSPPADGTTGFQNAQLLSPTTGWVWLAGRVYWTTTFGNNWQEITPYASGQQLTSLFFLDENNGWALLTGGADGDGTQPATIAVTNSGGSNWIPQTFSIADPQPQYGLPAGTAAITFADAQHGWITVRTTTDQNPDAGVLYATSDGGQSWRQLPSPPAGDPVRFVTAQFGWQAGGATGHELYVTQDGGISWQTVQVDIPPGLPMKSIHFAAPVFSNGQEGILVAEMLLQDNGSVLLGYRTEDGGKTWVVRNSVGTSAVAVGPGAVTDSLVIWSYAGEHELAFTNGDGTVRAVAENWRSSTIPWAGFADRDHGWIVAASSGCTAPNKANCWQREKLLATDNAGASLNDITPK